MNLIFVTKLSMSASEREDKLFANRSVKVAPVPTKEERFKLFKRTFPIKVVISDSLLSLTGLTDNFS